MLLCRGARHLLRLQWWPRLLGLVDDDGLGASRGGGGGGKAREDGWVDAPRLALGAGRGRGSRASGGGGGRLGRSWPGRKSLVIAGGMLGRGGRAVVLRALTRIVAQHDPREFVGREGEPQLVRPETDHRAVPVR